MVCDEMSHVHSMPYIIMRHRAIGNVSAKIRGFFLTKLGLVAFSYSKGPKGNLCCWDR